MTTRREAETVLFATCQTDKFESGSQLRKLESGSEVPKVDSTTGKDGKERRRVCATYCPICGGWVEVRLRPVRLHCTGCGVEARP